MGGEGEEMDVQEELEGSGQGTSQGGLSGMMGQGAQGGGETGKGAQGSGEEEEDDDDDAAYYA
jgi:hypothetical protein